MQLDLYHRTWNRLNQPNEGPNESEGQVRTSWQTRCRYSAFNSACFFWKLFDFFVSLCFCPCFCVRVLYIWLRAATETVSNVYVSCFRRFFPWKPEMWRAHRLSFSLSVFFPPGTLGRGQLIWMAHLHLSLHLTVCRFKLTRIQMFYLKLGTALPELNFKISRIFPLSQSRAG